VTTNATGELVLESIPVTAPAGWDELILSWNAGTNLQLRLEVQALGTAGTTRWYPLGVWSAEGERGSTNHVHDDAGEVDTDILRLKRPAASARVRLTLQGQREQLKLVALAFYNRQLAAVEQPSDQRAWGRLAAVPVRTQAEFPEGIDKWCSPTSTSMVLEYWAHKLKRPDLNFTVPASARAVYDPGWGGTGNWSFNTAFAGSQPGLRACVCRFNDLVELERWVAPGFPVAVSISYSLLKGRAAAEKGDGHIVVVRGFTPTGDVAINDPGVRRERVQWVVPRAHFIRAWVHSHRTSYLIWPENEPPPAVN
jgi:hypothetical protein